MILKPFLCQLGIHNTYWSSFVMLDGKLFDGYTCKRCHQKWQRIETPVYFEVWWALRNLQHVLVKWLRKS